MIRNYIIRSLAVIAIWLFVRFVRHTDEATLQWTARQAASTKSEAQNLVTTHVVEDDINMPFYSPYAESEDGEDPMPSSEAIITLPATPPPMRPQPIPMNMPGLTHEGFATASDVLLDVSFSWPLPQPAEDTNPFRADLDTAIDLGSGTIFGAGCNDTWGQRNRVTFSGDDSFSPGKESYRVRVPRSSLEMPNQPIVLSAAWFRDVPVNPSPVTITVTASSNDTVLSTKRLILKVFKLATRSCPAFGRSSTIDRFAFSTDYNLAKVQLSVSNLRPTFELVEVEQRDPDAYLDGSGSADEAEESEADSDPIESEEPLAPFTAPYLILNFTWSGPTFINTAVVMPNGTSATGTVEKVGFHCDVEESNIARTDGNPYSPVGDSSIFVSLGNARETGAFDESGVFRIALLADWDNWGGVLVSPTDGSVKVTALIQFGDNSRGPAKTVTIFPGSSRGCGSRSVGAAVVSYDADDHKFSFSLTAAAADEDGYALVSADPRFLQFAEPLMKEGPGLRITFSWDVPRDDLDTSVRVGSYWTGVGCPQRLMSNFPDWLMFSENDNSFKGLERYIVKLDLAREQGVWSDVVEVELFASWFNSPRNNRDLATLTIESVDEEGEVVGSPLDVTKVMINPVQERVEGSIPESLDCVANKVGKIRIMRANNGTFDTKVFIYAREDVA